MSSLHEEMGIRLLKRRKQLNLTQEKLAELADVSSQLISTAELGKKALRPENIIKLCSVLQISTDYLLLGKISCRDLNILNDKLSCLTPQQFRNLEDIVDSFLDAVCTQDK